MNILIFGAGAVGQALGCILASNGHHIHLIVRPRFIKQIKEKGLSVTGIFGEFYAEPELISLSESIEEVMDSGFDFTIITAKSYDTLNSAEEIKKMRHPSIIVSMQNGCGNLEILEKYFGPYMILGARVITGFEILRPGTVKITVSADKIHIGGTTEGEIPEKAVILAELINITGLPCEPTPFIRRDLFAKLLYNSALNPLGAILGVHYGALGDSQNARNIMDNIIREVFAVIIAKGAKTHWEKPEEYMEYFYGHQIPLTYNHRPSMLQDLENGKRTEVDSLTGYVSNEGKIYNVPTPVCDTLSGIVRFMEERRIQ